jgi:hypothetical protein
MSKFISYIALSVPSSFEAGATIHALKQVCATAPVEMAIAQAQLKESQNGFILSVNGVEVVVLNMAEPLPPNAYDAAASGSMLWRDAKQQLAQNRAHVVVASLRDSTSHAEALASAFAVTVVSAGVIQQTRAIGVIFNPALTAFPAQSFYDMAVELAQKRQIPEMLWVSIDFMRGPNTAAGQPTVGLSTMGMFPFIGREIEFEPMPWQAGEVAQRVLGLCQYLILNGPVVKDGDTVGNAPNEKIVATYVSQLQRGVPGIRLTVATNATPIPPVYPSGKTAFGKRSA